MDVENKTGIETIKELLKNDSFKKEGIKHFIIVDDGKNTTISTYSSCSWLIEKLYMLGKEDPTIVRILRATAELLDDSSENKNNS